MKLINPDVQKLAEALQAVNWHTLEGFELDGLVELEYKSQLHRSANYILEAKFNSYQPQVMIKLTDRWRGLWVEAPFLLEQLRNKELIRLGSYNTIQTMINRLNNFKKPEDFN